jgi:transaldolase
MNPLLRVQELGQSIWLDLLSRNLIRSGKLKKLIDSDGLSGVTSNPTIFEKAIGGSDDYDSDIRHLSDKGKSPRQIYEMLAVQDIQEACELFRQVHARSRGSDGYVSLEVSPLLAHDTDWTIREAQRLWTAADRSNMFIKIPATAEGVPAIAACIAEGININVTLLFGLRRYRQVVDAVMEGLERRLQLGHSLGTVRSVASFFLSRIDVLVDNQLEARSKQGGELADRARELRGRTAIASAKIAYQIHKELFGSKRFRKLEENGAHRQRLLWGSTSTKNKEYSDVKYVEALIGPYTINTIPMETLDAYRDHGDPAARLEENLESERSVLSDLDRLGVDLDWVSDQLESEGIQKFAQPFGKLLDEISKKAHVLHVV